MDLLVCPRIREVHFTTFGLDVGERVEDVSEGFDLRERELMTPKKRVSDGGADARVLGRRRACTLERRSPLCVSSGQQVCQKVQREEEAQFVK